MFIAHNNFVCNNRKNLQKNEPPQQAAQHATTKISPPHGFCENCGKLLSYPKEKLKEAT
jgi:hypothetical protein